MYYSFFSPCFCLMMYHCDPDPASHSGVWGAPMLAACIFKEPCKEGVFKHTTEAEGIVVSYYAPEQQHCFWGCGDSSSNISVHKKRDQCISVLFGYPVVDLGAFPPPSSSWMHPHCQPAGGLKVKQHPALWMGMLGKCAYVCLSVSTCT